MAPKKSITFICLLGLASLALAWEVGSGQTGQIRVKRQANQRLQNQQDERRPISTGISAEGTAQALASAIGSPFNGNAQLGGSVGAASPQAQPANRPKRPKAPVATAEANVDSESAQDDEEPPVQAKPKRKRKRPVNRRPVVDEEEDERDDEACDDDYDDYDSFHEMAFRPMRHIGRMMNGMFDKMQGLAARGFNGFPAGGNSAVASSVSGGDGFSRTSSLVNNNGRTRGVVSETRNGRTRTRRIGADDDEEEE